MTQLGHRPAVFDPRLTWGGPTEMPVSLRRPPQVVVIFGGNASGHRCRSESYSADLLTADVVFELINQELLMTDRAFDKIAD